MGKADVQDVCVRDAGRKLLVFAHHKVVLNTLEDALKRMRVGDEGPPRQVGPCCRHTLSKFALFPFQQNVKFFVT